jgi:hypothetical protein
MHVPVYVCVCVCVWCMCMFEWCVSCAHQGEWTWAQDDGREFATEYTNSEPPAGGTHHLDRLRSEEEAADLRHTRELERKPQPKHPRSLNPPSRTPLHLRTTAASRAKDLRNRCSLYLLY